MTNEPRSANKPLLYAVLAVVILLLIAGAIALFNKKGDNDGYRQAGTEESEQATDDDSLMINGSAVSVSPAATPPPTASATPAATPEIAAFSAADVASHKDASSCYVTVGGNVFDLTAWIAQHPGGRDAILGLCGTDGTAAFSRQHGSNAKAQAALASFKIGVLR